MPLGADRGGAHWGLIGEAQLVGRAVSHMSYECFALALKGVTHLGQTGRVMLLMTEIHVDDL